MHLYDAAGRRIAKQNSGNSTEDYLYDLAGRRLVTMSSASTWTLSEIYAGGRHLATYTPTTTHFRHTDWLGTTRARTNPSGTVTVSCSNEPFGSNQACSGTDATPEHFTGHDNDDAGLTHTWFRQYPPTQARWTSPDLLAGEISHPQSLNRYAYVLNDPLNYNDPLGANESMPDSMSWLWNRYVNAGNSWDGWLIGGGGGSFGSAASEVWATGLQRYLDAVDLNFTGYTEVTCANGSSTTVRGMLSAPQAALAGICQTVSNLEERQRLAVTQALLRRVCGRDATFECTKQVYDSLEKTKLEGGNFNFSLDGIARRGLSIDLTGCAGVRCGFLGSLHFDSPGNPTSVHLDTANPYVVPIGSLVHWIVDVVLGNTVWASGIPR